MSADMKTEKEKYVHSDICHGKVILLIGVFRLQPTILTKMEGPGSIPRTERGKRRGGC